jgi:hypothetical protein
MLGNCLVNARATVDFPVPATPTTNINFAIINITLSISILRLVYHYLNIKIPSTHKSDGKEGEKKLN